MSTNRKNSTAPKAHPSSKGPSKPSSGLKERNAELEENVKQMRVQCELLRHQFDFQKVQKEIKIDDQKLIAMLTETNRQLNQKVQELESTTSKNGAVAQNSSNFADKSTPNIQTENENDKMTNGTHVLQRQRTETTNTNLKERNAELEENVKRFRMQYELLRHQFDLLNQIVQELESTTSKNESLKNDLKSEREKREEEKKHDQKDSQIPKSAKRDVDKQLQESESAKKAADLQIDLNNKIDIVKQLRQDKCQLEYQLKDARESLDTLKLSKVVGAQIKDGNPDIADLSDLNRPTKLAERYAELFDDEWTDAYEEIEGNGKKEVDVIKQLLETLKDVYKFCQKVSKDYESGIKTSALVIPGSAKGRPKTPKLTSTLRKQIVELRKTFAPTLTEDVFTQFLKTLKKSVEKSPKTKLYMKTCVEICWLMSIQDPPVVLDTDDPKGAFDGFRYKPYTRSGKTFDYVVWPPMRLHEAGALLGKGVAQAK